MISGFESPVDMIGRGSHKSVNISQSSGATGGSPQCSVQILGGRHGTAMPHLIRTLWENQLQFVLATSETLEEPCSSGLSLEKRRLLYLSPRLFYETIHRNKL